MRSGICIRLVLKIVRLDGGAVVVIVAVVLILHVQILQQNLDII